MKKIKSNVIKSIIIILFCCLILHYLPYIKTFDIKIKFNIYRSIMCTYFVIKSLEFLKNEENIYDYFSHNIKLEPLIILFSSYIIIDIIFTLSRTKKRYDLLIHHFIVIGIIIIGYKYKIIGNIFPILLLNEAISIVSGFDSVSLKLGKINESIFFKQIRKYIILGIRLPIWFFLLYICLRESMNKNLIDSYIILNSVKIINILMIILDFYWYNKCNKFISNNMTNI